MSRNEPYTRLCGGDWQSARPLAPFDGGVMAFLSDLGAALIADREARAYPDVVAFGFFCRRANLEALAREYEGAVSDRLGRGISFHIAPSNVPVNFAYSLAAGLLAGVCFRSGRLPRTRLTLTLFGALCVLLPVGLILDTSSLFLMTGDPLTVDSAMAIYLAGVSANVIHAAATAFFLFLIGPVVLEKLERVKVKYGLME